MTWGGSHTYADEDSGSATILNLYVRNNLEWYYDNLPIRSTLFHDEAIVTTGNAITRVPNSLQYYNVYSYQNASADGDAWSQSCVLAPGVYRLEALGRLTPSSGKLAITIDGAKTIAFDLYGSITPNVNVFNVTFTVETAKRIVISGLVEGQNASSSGYDIQLTNLDIQKLTEGDA